MEPEESWILVDWLPLGISLLALVVAMGSAWVARRAPHVAEGLRRSTARIDLKRSIFLTLMQERAMPFTEEAVRAFNGIDVVFVDAHDVREKWGLYYKSLDLREKMSDDTKKHRLTDLLAAMAADIGLTGIKATDLERSYMPDYLHMSKRVEVETAKRSFSELAANRTPQAPSGGGPKP